ncbi:MAG: hypothetical protein P4L50_23765 [Anaerolineaceae bacterium]|nr:hypothetical protein [Anaerolineaceae bacterium]
MEMYKTIRKAWAQTVWAVLVALMMGCQPTRVLTPAPTSSPPAATTQMQAAAGSQHNLAFGLGHLASYQVSYTKSVLGKLDGQPYQIHENIRRVVIAVPAAEDSEVTELRADGTAYYLHDIHVGNTTFFQTTQNGACQGVINNQAGEVIGNPAERLPAPGWTQNLGMQTINGMRATHFHFDGKALNMAPGEGKAAGDLWTAELGGYVVKYVLQIQPPAAPTGKGLEAQQIITYEVNEINQVERIEPPPACRKVAG